MKLPENLSCNAISVKIFTSIINSNVFNSSLQATCKFSIHLLFALAPSKRSLSWNRESWCYSNCNTKENMAKLIKSCSSSSSSTHGNGVAFQSFTESNRIATGNRWTGWRQIFLINTQTLARRDMHTGVPTWWWCARFKCINLQFEVMHPPKFCWPFLFSSLLDNAERKL